MDGFELRQDGSIHVPYAGGPEVDDSPVTATDPQTAKPKMPSDVLAAQYFRQQQLSIRMTARAGARDVDLLEMEVLGRVTLARELEAFGTWDGLPYKLKSAERDRLLAQGRSDIAASYAILRTSLAEIIAVRRRDRRLLLLVLLCLATNAATLAVLLLS